MRPTFTPYCSATDSKHPDDRNLECVPTFHGSTRIKQTISPLLVWIKCPLHTPGLRGRTGLETVWRLGAVHRHWRPPVDSTSPNWPLMSADNLSCAQAPRAVKRQHKTKVDRRRGAGPRGRRSQSEPKSGGDFCRWRLSYKPVAYSRVWYPLVAMYCLLSLISAIL